MKSRLVLVVEAPFSARDHKRFGVNQLSDLNFSVEVWEVFDWLRPATYAGSDQFKSNVDVRSVSNRNEFRRLTGGLTQDDKVILIGFTRFPLSSEQQELLRCLFDTSALIGSVIVGNLPPHSAGLELRQRALRRLHQAERRVRGSHGFVRSLDYLWVDTSYASVDKSVLGSRTTIRYVHALDVDLLDGVTRNATTSPYALILDSMGPLHPDWSILNVGNPWPLGCYEAMAKATISKLVERGFPVVVAAHPRASTGEVNHLYEGADVQYGNTIKLLASASFAVTLEGSTSLGVAAFLNVPVLLLTSDCQSKYVRDMLNRFSRALHVKPQAVASLETSLLPPPISEKNYETYVQSFVKRPGTPQGNFWRTVANDLLGETT